jgi:hypothetical protein
MMTMMIKVMLGLEPTTMNGLGSMTDGMAMEEMASQKKLRT